MKKLSILLLTIVLSFVVTGCGNISSAVESKTCSLAETSGVTQTFKFTAKNDEITGVELKMVFNNSLFNLDTLSTLTDDQKEQIKTNMLKNLGLESDTYEGLEIAIEIKDQMTVTIKADLAKADPEVLKKIGMDFEGADMSFDRAIKDMEASGASCK